MSEAQLWESNILRNLQQVSEAQGLKFYVNPPREVIPEFLGDFQPDAIALSREGGTIIELKRRKSPSSEKQLSAIAEKVCAQKGWEFRVIYLNPPTDETPPIEKPTPEQLEGTFLEIESLVKGGHFRAAFVTAWTALESLARLASAYGEARRHTAFSPIQAIQALAEEGYVENEAANRLREMTKLRNAVVHGDLSIHVTAGQVENLLKEVRAIASDIMTVGLEQNAPG